ncbi:MAG: tight adherence protein [Actinomycetota bacterium]|nr:tight adherence protein [Actinomycetota bacterium]
MGAVVTTAAVLVLPLSVLALGVALRAAVAVHHRSSVGRRLPPSPGARGRAGGPGRGVGGGTGGVGSGRPGLPAAPPWLERALSNAAVPVTAATAWLGWLTALVASTALAAIASGPAAAVLALLAVGGLPPVALHVRRGRADSAVENDLPSALESIARSLRSGASVRQAIGEAAGGPGPGGTHGRTSATGRAAGVPVRGGGGLRAELAIVADQAEHGAGLVEALEGLAVRRPSPGVRLAVAALCLGVDTGGAQARAVDGVAATMRERLAVEAEVRALSSQARMSALVIGLAPLGFGVFAAATDPRTSEFLLHTPGGLVLVCVGLLLDSAGWLWMQRLCRVTV